MSFAGLTLFATVSLSFLLCLFLLLSMPLFPPSYSHTNLDDEVGVRPHSSPQSTLLPSGNSMSFFTVRAGSSYHAVSEVQAEPPRARVSIQGWYHGTKPVAPLHALPTLDVIKSLTATKWKPVAVTPTGGPEIDIQPMYLQQSIQIQVAQQLMTQQSVNLTAFLQNPPAVPQSKADVERHEKKAAAMLHARGINPICERFVHMPALLDTQTFVQFIVSLMSVVQGIEVRVALFCRALCSRTYTNNAAVVADY